MFLSNHVYTPGFSMFLCVTCYFCIPEYCAMLSSMPQRLQSERKPVQHSAMELQEHSRSSFHFIVTVHGCGHNGAGIKRCHRVHTCC
ncbi:hypothetical protein CALVIDRAFT_491957 [Calocera viscosa TUFC12733]|uniref:Uncharacterized protein n=1 Tax=Calocera viscosa (strain TUFC12733) TaxID=1330018 RepID=A0A167S084_CALVF|nr:hypothetical protein CALVIDRAFT_491957 [Calocera viscosa TUFC12733]